LWVASSQLQERVLSFKTSTAAVKDLRGKIKRRASIAASVRRRPSRQPCSTSRINTLVHCYTPLRIAASAVYPPIPFPSRPSRSSQLSSPTASASHPTSAAVATAAVAGRGRHRLRIADRRSGGAWGWGEGDQVARGPGQLPSLCLLPESPPPPSPGPSPPPAASAAPLPRRGRGKG
jgi:hypothetical protein